MGCCGRRGVWRSNIIVLHSSSSLAEAFMNDPDVERAGSIVLRRRESSRPRNLTLASIVHVAHKQARKESGIGSQLQV